MFIRFLEEAEQPKQDRKDPAQKEDIVVSAWNKKDFDCRP